MSYEGYTQHICKNGHYFETGCYEDLSCPFCKEVVSSWSNEVDQTNGPSQGAISIEKLREKYLKTEAVKETCTHCNHTKVISPEIFHIPDWEHTKELRVYVDEDMILGC